MQIETERKFLIAYPDINLLLSQKGIETKEIVQTYLLSENGVTDRVRKVISNGTEFYVRTRKKRISDVSCFEEEKRITFEEYEKLLEKADKSLSAIIKTRHVFPFQDHIIEIDIYPFWNDRAILEVELTNETEAFGIPGFLSVIKEVTDDKRYKNARLAGEIPYDVI